MGEKPNDQSIMDKSMRSVFVGNIPYEATEDKLKEIFNEVGPVLSLKLVFDRESGKPKGYGFCEYKDQETALSAMRNLNGYEIGGRTLRVDNACTEKSRMEMQQLLQGPQVENPYGDICSPENAPEQITKTVASLPPEQMFELMKQMKACIQNNPSEARQMLLQNPQLAYALLQAQVVMRIVDPQRAVTMLHKSNVMPPVLGGQPQQQQHHQQQPQPVSAPPPQQQQLQMHPPLVDPMLVAAGMMPQPVPPVGGFSLGPQQAVGGGGGDVDLRNVGVGVGGGGSGGRSMDQDMRGVLPHDGGAFQRNIPPPQQQQQQQQQRMPSAPFQPNADPRQRPVDPRVKMQQQQHQQQPPPGMPSALQQPPPGMPPSIIASAAGLGGVGGGVGGSGGAASVAAAAAAAAAARQQTQQQLAGAGIPNNASDQEKAALIMQVLQLSDEQIAMLPPEQRASILVLKEQIAKSTQR